MSIPYRKLGHDGPQVPAVGLGLMSIGGIYGSAGSLDEKLGFLNHAHAVGQCFWDTADLYRDSEDIVGEWFKRSGKRNNIFLATKFGVQRDSETGNMTVRSDPEYVRTACERSLKRLGIGTIDLYYCHRVDGVTPIEKTIQAMVDLKNQGKIRYLGISEVSAATLRRAHAVHPITALQIEYSPFALDIEWPKVNLLNTCRELGIAVVAYSPIGRGILTGQIRSFEELPEKDLRRTFPKYSPENFPKILKMVDGLKAVAKTHDATPAQAAIAWVLAQGPDIIPIPGTRSAQRMEENNRAALIQLSDKEVQDIGELIKENEVQGDRYPATMGGFLGETPALNIG